MVENVVVDALLSPWSFLVTDGLFTLRNRVPSHLNEITLHNCHCTHGERNGLGMKGKRESTFVHIRCTIVKCSARQLIFLSPTPTQQTIE